MVEIFLELRCHSKGIKWQGCALELTVSLKRSTDRKQDNPLEHPADKHTRTHTHTMKLTHTLPQTHRKGHVSEHMVRHPSEPRVFDAHFASAAQCHMGAANYDT